MADNDYILNTESGFPSKYDYYSIGSEETVKSMISTPDQMTMTAQAARLNPHQNEYDTQHVGVPGTTWTPSKSDRIFQWGGHFLIFGQAAGNETLRIQSKQGATIEMDSHGAMKIVSAAGLHLGIGGEGHIVLSGDLNIVTNGALKFKSSSVYFDCHDFNIMASGNMLQHVHGSFNSSIVGDSHTTVQGDTSTMVGGDHVEASAGSYKKQVTGDMSYSGKGKATFGSVGNMSVGTKGTLGITSEGDATYNSKGKTNLNSTSDLNVVTAGAAVYTSTGTTDVNSTGTLSLKTSGTLNATTSGALKLGGGSSVDVQSGSNKATPDFVSGASVTASSPTSANVSVANVNVVVADEKTLLDNVGDHNYTQGAIDKIYNVKQLDDEFSTEDGGTIPDKVKERATQLGVLDSSYQSPSGNPVTDSGAGAITALNTGVDFNPVG